MRAGIVVNVTRADRRRLEAIVSDRSAPQKHVWRAQIILATADGCGTMEIMRRSGKAKPVVWRWQQRFMEEGVDGLLRDKTRKPGKPPLPAATVQKVIDLVTGPPPGEATHWTGRMLARAVGISLRSVQRILEAHHAIIDNYATHRHPKVRKWLTQHPRWTFHFTPTSASWLTAVEGFFAKLTNRRLKRGVFRSVAELETAIERFIAETNADPKPFLWTARPNRILAAVKRGKQTLEGTPNNTRFRRFLPWLSGRLQRS